jgi:large repetitive protein
MLDVARARIVLAVVIAIGCGSSSKPAGPECGNGLLEAMEECEGSPVPLGCTNSCIVAEGWACTMPEPAGDTDGDAAVPWESACLPTVGCGNGTVDTGELCDDHNLVDGDGCSECQPDEGWACSGDPSVCQQCGDGVVAEEFEACDGGGEVPGCTAACQVIPGWTCAGEPSACLPICGDGVWLGASVLDMPPELAEDCDDGNSFELDGCDSQCRVEDGCECFAQPTETSACQCEGDTTGSADSSSGGEESSSGGGSSSESGSGSDGGSSSDSGSSSG